MSHLAAVRALLMADATVSGLVGSKVFPSVAKQGAALPFIVLRMISDVPLTDHTSDPDDLLAVARVQVDCYSDDYGQAHAVAEAVDDVLSALSGPAISAYREGSQDAYEDAAGKGGVYGVSSDYFVSR